MDACNLTQSSCTVGLEARAEREKISVISSTALELLGGLRCTALPKEFWRVQHGRSQAEFDEEGDLLAKVSN